MEFADHVVDLPETDGLSVGLMLDITTEKSLLDDCTDTHTGCSQQTGDLCKELSPTSSECLFANLPLFGECGLELTQDCSSPCVSDSADSTASRMSGKTSGSVDREEVKSLLQKRKVSRSEGKSRQRLPHMCPVCEKTFLYSSNLTSHLKRHGKKNFKCTQCDKTFALSVNYEAHLRFHSGIKPYSCEVCGKSFSWSGGYHRHMRIHSGLKPYTCSDCGKEFSDIGNFNNHRRIHTGERPHVCSECGKGFSRSDSLNRHMITHSQVKMFACALCGHEFKHLESLNKHCRHIHDVLKPHKRAEGLKHNHHVTKLPKQTSTKD